MKTIVCVFALILVGSGLDGCGTAGASNCSGANCPPTTQVVTHFSVIGAPKATAGTPSSIVVTALDATETTVPSYSGFVHFTSSDAQAVLPPDSKLADGSQVFSITYKTVGTQSVSVLDTNNATVSGKANSIVSARGLSDATGPFPNGTIAQPYGVPFPVTDNKTGCSVSFTGIEFQAAGGLPPYSWNLTAAPGTSLPPGIGIEQQSKTCGGSTRCCTTVTATFIGGTPTTAGTYYVTVKVVDSASPPAQASADYVIVISDPPAAQAKEQEDLSRRSQVRYRLIDLGTFGGPGSQFPNGADGILNNRGVAAGWSRTADADPYAPNCFDVTCFVTHAFQAQGGERKDLGTLSGGTNSQAVWVTENGLVAGVSQNGEIDPFVPGFAELRAVLWRNGEIIDLGTLPEGGYESVANGVNNRGQVIGFALNTVPDPFSFIGFPTQVRAFLWQNGRMKDLGTLGGSDALAGFINDQGEVVGPSYTAETNPNTGLPVVHPFLWRDGKMIDLGSLGGTDSEPTGLNEMGQVIGLSTLAGDSITHPFLWRDGRMHDLGTLGGDNGTTNWINDRGDVVGKADLGGPSPQLHDAVLWADGKAIDLGVLSGDACSNAYFVNSHGQVVGTSENQQLCAIPAGQHAFLWEHGGPMLDLNTLVPSDASLTLTHALAINERGEIAGLGVPSGCAVEDVELCGHAFLLIPCTPGDRCTNLSLPAAHDQAEPAVGAKAPESSGTKTAASSLQLTLDAIRSRIRLLRRRDTGSE